MVEMLEEEKNIYIIIFEERIVVAINCKQQI